MAVIYGINAVSEALKSRGRAFEYVAVARERHDQSVQKIIADCRAQGIAVRSTPREELDRMVRTNSHQGVVAVTSEKEYVAADDLLAQRRAEHSFIVVLDGVEDPHNLGAII